MSTDAAVVLVVSAAAIVLFIIDIWPVEKVAIAVPAALALGGVIDLESAVSGLSNPATLAVAGFLVIGLALDKTGVVGSLAGQMRRLSWASHRLRLATLCCVVAAVSPFLSNTAVVVVSLPVFLRLARQAGEPPSRVLIPLSYSAILGGTVTLIGTSTNLIVHTAARNRGFGELGLFSIAPLGLIYLAVGMLYLLTIGRRLLPVRPNDGDLDAAMTARSYTADLRVSEDSPAVGSPLDRDGWLSRYELRRVELVQPWHGLLSRPQRNLAVGDMVSVTGEPRAIFACARGERLVVPLADPGNQKELHIAEFMVAPGSMLVGRSLQSLRFASRFGVVVIAVQRAQRPLSGHIASERLSGGDLLMVQGSASALAQVAQHDALVAIGEQEPHHRAPGPAWLSLAILAATVGVAATDLLPIAEAALLGAVAMIFGRCVRLEEIYRDLSWPTLALLAGLLPLGVAMDTSGAADAIGAQAAAWMGEVPPAVAIGGLYLFTSLLTELMSNQAAAVVLTPLAINAAQQLDMNPYALIVAVMFGASAALMTPIGYPTNTIIYGPGGYRFSDFLRVGAPLNLLLAIVAAYMIPIFWP